MAPAFADSDPDIRISYTGDCDSFAFPTARERWPKILKQAISDIKQVTGADNHLSTEDKTAADAIQDKMSTLLADIAANKSLQQLVNDGGPNLGGLPDVEAFNAELKSFDPTPTWLNGPWLYLECYLYRLLHSFCVQSTPFWQRYDMFANSKNQALVGSKKGAVELVKKMMLLLDDLKSQQTNDDKAQRLIFEEMVQISLWGNATDLSMLTSVSIEDLDSRQSKDARESSKSNIVADDTELAWALLSQLRSNGRTGTIHFVLDNAGFELLADLVFISYLLSTGLTKKVVLHGKRLPWFVSDVNKSDLDFLVDGFATGELYTDLNVEDTDLLRQAGKHWKSLMEQGKLAFLAEPFWTTQHPFGRLSAADPGLFQQLADADLVVYKGDLNYRKLTYDGQWPQTTPFTTAIGPLSSKQAQGQGTRTFALRTAKADVAVGVPLDLVEKLPKGWTYSGKYAMINYFDAKSL